MIIMRWKWCDEDIKNLFNDDWFPLPKYIYLNASGVVFQALLGAFFFVRAPSLAEDLPVNMPLWREKNYTYGYIKDLYRNAAINCWIATGLYVATFILSCILLKINLRQSNSS